MGCNCGKTAQKQNFIFTPPNGGKQVTYTSEVQARAAQIKAGGGSYQPVAAR